MRQTALLSNNIQNSIDMIISINNEIITLNSRTNLAELAFKYNTFGKDVIIAVNGRIIHRNSWDTTFAEDGDNITLL